MDKRLQNIQDAIDEYKKDTNNSIGELSDNYHTFNTLYEHRTKLFALLCLRIPYAWKSKTHEDGTMYDDMFIAGFPTPDGMITYHCDIEYWNLFKIPILPHAPKFGGYTPDDVLTRLEGYINSVQSSFINKNNLEAIEEIVEKEIIPTFGEDKMSIAAFIGFYNA